MTTRRGALGAIIGGVAAGPAAVTSAVETLLAGGDLSAATVAKAIAEVAPAKSRQTLKRIAHYQRIVNGEPDPDEGYPLQSLIGQDDHHERYYASLKSVSPMARALLTFERQREIQKANSLLYARYQLRRLLARDDDND